MAKKKNTEIPKIDEQEQEPKAKKNAIERMGGKVNSNGFAQNPQHAGRKANLIKQFIKEYFGREVSKRDLDSALASLAGLSRLELQDIVDRGNTFHDSTAVIVFMAAQQYNAALENPEAKESQAFLVKILEFLRGKPTEKIEVTVTQEIVIEITDLEGLTQSEINTYFKVTNQIEQAHRKRREALGEGQADTN